MSYFTRQLLTTWAFSSRQLDSPVRYLFRPTSSFTLMRPHTSPGQVLDVARHPFSYTTPAHRATFHTDEISCLPTPAPGLRLTYCRNEYIHHGSISHLSSSDQSRTKRKIEKRRDKRIFFPSKYLSFCSSYINYDNEHRHVAYLVRCVRLSR